MVESRPRVQYGSRLRWQLGKNPRVFNHSFVHGAAVHTGKTTAIAEILLVDGLFDGASFFSVITGRKWSPPGQAVQRMNDRIQGFFNPINQQKISPIQCE